MIQDKASAFWAIKVPLPVAQEIAQCLDDMRPMLEGGKARLYMPENYHITLLYADNRDSTGIEKMIQSVERMKLEPFSLTLKGVDAFFYKDIARVIYLNVTNGKNELMAMAQKLEDGFPLTLNKEYDDPYFPHLTLMDKIKCFLQEERLSLFEERLQDKQFTLNVEEIVLMDSSTHKSHGFYTALKTHKLG